MRVEPDTTLLLFGNGKAEIRGYAEIFGKKTDAVSVPEGKVFPLYFEDEAEIDLVGDYIQVRGDTVPGSWKKFVKKDYERIFTFGGIDSGKSSFCVYAINKMGVDFAIDSDIGQSDIAHPGAMGVGLRKSGVVSLSELELKEVAFVGAISPSGFESRCLRAFTKLCRFIKGKAIADTTGWVYGRKAREYKLSKIEVFSPDVIVAIESDPYFVDGVDVFRVESFVVRKRDRDMRAVIRKKNYGRWLENSEEVEKSVSELTLKNTTMFRGEEVSDSILETFGDVIYCERGADFLNIYSENYSAGMEAIKFLKGYFSVSEVNIIKPSELEGLVLGLGKGEKYLTMGLLKEIDFEEKVLRFLGLNEADVVEFGSFRLDEEKREVVVRVP